METPNGPQHNPVQHSMKRRSPWHDYRTKGTYMLTLVVKDRLPLLGTLTVHDGTPTVELSALGPLGVPHGQANHHPPAVPDAQRTG